MNTQKLLNWMAEDWKKDLEPQQHDCHLVGGNGEESCDAPEHYQWTDKYPEVSQEDMQ